MVSHQYAQVGAFLALNYLKTSSFSSLFDKQTITNELLWLTFLSPCVNKCFLRAGISLKSFLHSEWWLHLYKFFSTLLYKSLSKSEIPFLSPLVEAIDWLWKDL